MARVKFFFFVLTTIAGMLYSEKNTQALEKTPTQCTEGEGSRRKVLMLHCKRKKPRRVVFCYKTLRKRRKGVKKKYSPAVQKHLTV